MRWREEVSSNGSGKVPGYAGRPWSYVAGGARVNNATSGNYHKTTFIRDTRHGNQVAG